MSVEEEFKTVDIVLASGTATLGVDAFALSLIKAEKQARRLVTYLVYQHSWCSQATVADIRGALEIAKNVYFEGLLKGWDALYPRSIRQLVGKEYDRLQTKLSEATNHRNKIFHGQLTAQCLTRKDLIGFVTDIRAWCELLGASAQSEVGYDGCGGKSFHKAKNAPALCMKYKTPLANLAAYERFISDHMKR